MKKVSVLMCDMVALSPDRHGNPYSTEEVVVLDIDEDYRALVSLGHEVRDCDGVDKAMRRLGYTSYRSGDLEDLD
tara:strand:- start:1385 stop:1609 length:225 start_codon:yes stop_codon:yes gene_type:complete